jgi:hypothetical protein
MRVSMKIAYFSISLFLITSCFCYETNHYVIQRPGEIAPFEKFKRSYRPIGEYGNLQIQDDDVIAQERYKIVKEIELEGRVPYQESRQTVITRNVGSNSNK